jgi:ABC-type multidrug transport system ATPase subunit
LQEALDLLGQHLIMDLLTGMRGSKAAVISSHDLTEIEQRCHTVGVLDEGKLI